MLNWTPSQLADTRLFSAQQVETSEHILRESVEACADKAIQLLPNNIQDDSSYLLFEWQAPWLSAVVTNAAKNRDSPQIVRCELSGLAAELARLNDAQKADYMDTLKFWLHDYLASNTGFLKYSLVAIFHSSDRDQSELL